MFCNHLYQERRYISKRIGLLGGIALAAVLICYAVVAADDLSDVNALLKKGYVHLEAGKAAAGEKKYDQAAQEYTLAIEKFDTAHEIYIDAWDSDDWVLSGPSIETRLAEAYMRRGAVYYLLQDLIRAEFDIKSSIRWNDNLIEPHVILASIHIIRGEEKLARSEYRVLKDDLGAHDWADKVLQDINKAFPPPAKTK